MGSIYFTGNGIPAEVNPGNFYLPSGVVAVDPAQGLHWTGLAAEHGSRKAQMSLAYAYQMGWDGLPKDEALSQKYLAQAVDNPVHTIEELRDAMFQIIDIHKVYPKESVAAHQTGVVRVTFMAPDRKVTAYTIDKSSGYPALDQAVKQALAECVFPPRAPSLAGVQRFTVAVNFELPPAQSAPGAATTAGPAH